MKPYKLAKIYKGKQWYVWYSYLNPATGKFERQPPLKKGINRIKDRRDRLTEANKLKEAINELLITGALNPYADEDTTTETSYMPLSEALQWAFERAQKRWSKSTVDQETSTLKMLQAGIKESINPPICRVKKPQVKRILERTQEINKVGNARYNSYLALFSILLTEMEEWGIIEYNPALKLKRKDPGDSQLHRPLNDDELLIVAADLKKECFPFYVFCKIIFRTGARMVELMNIKAEHILSDAIALRPDKPTRKQKERNVPIDDDLRTDILKIGAEPGQYVFSVRMKPGPLKIHPERMTERWRRYVQRDLDINKTLYALKPTGLDARLTQGNSMDDVQHSFGHSSKNMTRVYDKHNREKQIAGNRLREVIPKF